MASMTALFKAPSSSYFTDGLMIEHLRKLLQLGKLSNQQLDILRNLSLLPVAGVLKNNFKNWMKLDNLTDVNHLIKYGFINEDTDNINVNIKMYKSSKIKMYKPSNYLP